MNYAKHLEETKKFPSLHTFFRHNFVCSVENWRAGRWWTLFTCSITHEQPLHLFVNMYCLWNFGPMAISVFGIPGFAAIWLVSELAGASLILYTQERRLSQLQQQYAPTLLSRRQIPRAELERVYAGAVGASGALFGLTSALAAWNPSLSIGIIFLPSGVPAWAAVGAFTAFSAYCSYDHSILPGWSHEGHLGGIVGGLVTYFAWLRPWMRRGGWG